MGIDLIRRFFLTIVLCAAQVLVFGKIHLFGFATPLPYIYIVLLFPRDFPRWAMLLWAFATGLLIDIFANTPGVAAASMTLLAMMRPLLLTPFMPRDCDETFIPRADAMGLSSFVYYSLAGVTVYCIVFFVLEIFSFNDCLYMLRCVLGSVALTEVLILAFETLRRK